jgi:hypothetical protein
VPIDDTAWKVLAGPCCLWARKEVPSSFAAARRTGRGPHAELPRTVREVPEPERGHGVMARPDTHARVAVCEPRLGHRFHPLFQELAVKSAMVGSSSIRIAAVFGYCVPRKVSLTRVLLRHVRRATPWPKA